MTARHLLFGIAVGIAAISARYAIADEVAARSQPEGGADILTPADAAKLEGKDKPVTVEFVVKSCHSVLPDGKHFRLLSESSLKEPQAFVIHLTDKAVLKLAADDLEKHFLGKKIRATGKVAKVVFSSTSETRPGITIDDAANIKFADEPSSGAATSTHRVTGDTPYFGKLQEGTPKKGVLHKNSRVKLVKQAGGVARVVVFGELNMTDVKPVEGQSPFTHKTAAGAQYFKKLQQMSSHDGEFAEGSLVRITNSGHPAKLEMEVEVGSDDLEPLDK